MTPEPTLRDINNRLNETRQEMAEVRLKTEAVIEIVTRLDSAIKRLEVVTNEIKSTLPKEFMTGTTYRVRKQ